MPRSRFFLPLAEVGDGISPFDGAKLQFYVTATSTPKDTYSQQSGGSANPNPVVADANGLFGPIWLEDDALYRAQLKDKNDNIIWTEDDVGSVTATAVEDVVTNVASIQGGSSTASIIHTTGYAAQGDGGAATYDYDASDTTTADDGFKTIVVISSGRRYKLRPIGGTYMGKQAGMKDDNGVTDNLSIFHGIIASLDENDRLTIDSTTQSYGFTDTIEIADINGVTINFGAARDTALAPFSTYPFKSYRGSVATGYKNAMIRILGCSYCTFNNLAIDASQKHEVGLWFTGINQFTSGGVTTSNRNRSLGCIFNGFANLNNMGGTNQRGARIGDAENGSSQTDVATFNNSYFRAQEGGIALNAAIVTSGAEMVGNNTYAVLQFCEATGDYSYQNQAAHINYYGCFGLGDGGFYQNSPAGRTYMWGCHTEGMILRGIWTDSGETADAQPMVIVGYVSLPGASANPHYFQNNASVFMVACRGEGWITDAAGGAYEKGVYIDVANKWNNPPDYSASPNVNVITLTNMGGATGGGLSSVRHFFNNLRRMYRDETAAPATMEVGNSFVNVLVVNSASGNNVTLPAAGIGMEIQAWRTGQTTVGTMSVKRQGTDLLVRHDTGATATDAILASGTENAKIVCECVQAGQWMITSTGTLTYV